VGVLAAALPALAAAQTVIRRGGEFVVNSYTYGTQRRVDVASSASGAFVTVQLQSSAGSCFTATYQSDVTTNGGGEFRARPDAP